jgi:hypothetical protein
MVTLMRNAAAFATRVRVVGIAAVILLGSVGVVSPIAGAVNGGCPLDGDGTAGSPYVVATASDLQQVGVGDCGLDRHYRQTANVTLTAPFTPIGMTIGESFGEPTYTREPFTGTYDGGGNVIHDLVIDLPTPRLGLFSELRGATVVDLEIRAADVRNLEEGSPGVEVGILAGRLSGFEDTGEGPASTIEGVRVSGRVEGYTWLGGLVGRVGSSGVTMCSDLTVHDVHADVDVRAADDRAGGVFGELRGDVNCSRNEDLRGTTVVRDVHAVGTITQRRDSRNRLGGLAGFVEGTNVLIESSSADVDIAAGACGTGTGCAGGLVGRLEGATIRSSVARGDVSARDANGDLAGGLIGGLVGELTNSGAVESSVAFGRVEGRRRVGGLVGEISRGGTVSASSAHGRVEGAEQDIGGLVGRLTDGTLSDVYARGPVIGGANSAHIGGLIGDLVGGVDFDNNPLVVIVSRAYSTGAVSGDSSVGGLIGRMAESGVTVVGSFWDTQTSTQASSAGGIGAVGLGTVAMRSFATFGPEPGADWPIVERWVTFAPTADPARIWGICSQVNDGYPFLLWEHEDDPCLDAPAAISGPTIGLSCAPSTVSVGMTVSCTVSSGDPGIEILWRAAYNPVFAEAGVMLDAAGSGTFTFVVPRAALGQEVTVELVEWLAPVSLGVAGVSVPAAVRAGEGPAPLMPLTAGPLLLLALAGALVLRRISTVGVRG